MLVASSIVSDSVVVDTAIVFSEAVDSALVGDPKLVEELPLTVSSLVIEVDTFVGIDSVIGVDLRTVVGVDSVVVLERDSVIVMVLVGDIVVTMALQLKLDTGGQVRLIQLQL